VDDPIIPHDLIREKAHRDFVAGKGRDGHGFNWHAREAISTYQEEWGRQHALWTQKRQHKEAACNS